MIPSEMLSELKNIRKEETEKCTEIYNKFREYIKENRKNIIGTIYKNYNSYVKIKKITIETSAHSESILFSYIQINDEKRKKSISYVEDDPYLSSSLFTSDFLKNQISNEEFEYKLNTIQNMLK